MNFATLSFAQTKATNKTTPKKPKIEDVLNQQVEMLNARIDSMTVVHTNIIAANAKYIDSMSIAHQQAIETVKNEQKEQYANYYNQLDSDFDRWLIILSLIWGAIGVAFGALAPFFLNKESEKRVEKKIDDFKVDVKNNTDDLKQHLQSSLQNNARAQRERNQLFSDTFSKQMEGKLNYINGKIEGQTYYINGIKTEVEDYVKQSKINSLLSNAQNILKKSPREAISIYTEILNMDSNHKEALLWRGIAYSNIEDSEKALSDLRKLTKLEPRHARAFNNIANVYAKEERDKEALKNYNTALKINPKYAAVYANIAMLYTERGKYHKALEFCDKALSIDDEMIKVHSQKRYIYTQLAKLSKEDSEKQQFINKIEQEGVVIKMLKDKYISELMSL